MFYQRLQTHEEQHHLRTIGLVFLIVSTITKNKRSLIAFIDGLKVSTVLEQ
jgi:hypothetical protein